MNSGNSCRLEAMANLDGLDYLKNISSMMLMKMAVTSMIWGGGKLVRNNERRVVQVRLVITLLLLKAATMFATPDNYQ